MVKKGTKITCPKRLEVLRKARMKALAVRKKKSAIRRKEKLLAKLEGEKRLKQIDDKINKLCDLDNISNDKKPLEEPLEEPKVVSPKNKKIKKVKFEVEEQNEKVVKSNTITHPYPKKKYEDPTNDNKKTNLIMTDDGQYVKVPLNQFNKFMFKYRGEQDKLKKREQPLQQRLNQSRNRQRKSNPISVPKSQQQLAFEREYNSVVWN